MITDSLIKKKFVHETLQEGILQIYSTQENVVRNNYHRRTGCSPRFPHTRLIARYQARTAPSSCESFLISVSWICSTASATTASASSSAGTLHSTTVWYGACSITRRSLSSVMASRMRYAKASVRNWKSHSTLKNHKLWQVNS